jgi:HSP20 family molecular chaperone IbpA
MLNELTSCTYPFNTPWTNLKPNTYTTTSYFPIYDNLFEDGENLIMEFDVPGFNEDNLSVEIDGNTLKIKGKRKIGGKVTTKTYERTISLESYNIYREETSALINDGLLTISFLKRENKNKQNIKLI